MLKKLRLVLKVAITGLTLSILSVFILKAPETHKNLIRHYVGSNTVMLKGNKSGGTGFFLNVEDKTYIITNKHVCKIGYKTEGDIYLYAHTSTGDVIRSKVIAMSKSHDLCALKYIANKKGLKLSSNLRVGQQIAIVGHPKLYPLQISRGDYIGSRVIRLLTNCQSKEIIAPYIITKRDFDFLNRQRNMLGYGNYCIKKVFGYHINAYSRGGSSGSPVVNFYGRVVGVLFAGNNRDQFDSYMVPLYEIENFVKESLNGK